MYRPRLLATILLITLSQAYALFQDEMQVYEEECLGENKYICLDGECIELDQYCNGHIDCRDGSDENFCPGQHNTEHLCNVTQSYPCKDRLKCIPYSWLCNGNKDCDDGSDETGCRTQFKIESNSTCKGFLCDEHRCISDLWVCDGVVDCADKSDEYNETLCRMVRDYDRYVAFDGQNCDIRDPLQRRYYVCFDQSFCLPEKKMCDGIVDCRDDSDEASFCDNNHWNTMCNNITCLGGSVCRPDRTGPHCECDDPNTVYSPSRGKCLDRDECAAVQPHCSHYCHNAEGRYSCECDEGYKVDRFNYLCFAPDPEAMIFYSTRNAIGVYKLKSREHQTVVTGLKKAHGVTYDGTYLYWVETAQGHQAIVRAKLTNVQGTKETLVSLGLEDPGSIAIDWLTNLMYFTDAELGHIVACHTDGLMCAIVNTTCRHPQYIALNPYAGEMYWADYIDRPVIMKAKMDGSDPETFIKYLHGHPSGLTLDIPNERLYYVDKHIFVVRLDGKGSYILLDNTNCHPFSLAVFENSVYWSDWASNTLQSYDKMYPPNKKRSTLVSLGFPVFGIHLYHPLLQRKRPSGCDHNVCSDMCLLKGDSSHTCVCPQGRKLFDNATCGPSSFRDLPQFLIIGGGKAFTSIRYNALGNAESRITSFNIGRVQAMAYNRIKRLLYIYDGHQKMISQVDMNDFYHGYNKLLPYKGLENIVDMDYDFVSDNLYMVDANRHFLEVISLKTHTRAIVQRYRRDESPISVCVIAEYGILMVAVGSRDFSYNFYIETMGMDGKNRKKIITSGLHGPHIRLRYSSVVDKVLISDEGNGIIDFIHPTGTGRENYRSLSTTVTSLAVSETTVFWTDRRTSRLFWSDIHETGNKIRRLELTIFPNHTQLYLQHAPLPPKLSSPLLNHPCFVRNPCTHVCLQAAHPSTMEHPKQTMDYTCICPPGLVLIRGICEELESCPDKLYCVLSNKCTSGRRCDGVKNCPDGEDEEGCGVTTESAEFHCSSDMKMCGGECVPKAADCRYGTTTTWAPTTLSTKTDTCDAEEFKCRNSSVCIERSQLCDGERDCPDGSDEMACDTNTCYDWEFRCAVGSCIAESWRCDGEPDCSDESDELDCGNKSCSQGFYQCRSHECIELRRRCDGQQDCLDYSDEDDCIEDELLEIEPVPPSCEENEYTCELNRSICLPLSARCNAKVECPGGTDEADCNFLCSASAGLFRCEHEAYCIPNKFVCDGKEQCKDGSDESLFNCPEGNKTEVPVTAESAPEKCENGFRCKPGRCLEWHQVCDGTPDCLGSYDEMGHCKTACDNHTCQFRCQPTPIGGICLCPKGYKMEGTKCQDIDECAEEVCSQKCHNLAGSFYCSCHHGYALRSNRRTCKALKGNMSVLYISGNSVRSIQTDGVITTIYNSEMKSLYDMDYDVREKILYVTSKDTQGLIVHSLETNETNILKNIEQPTKIALDWITGNVYLVDTGKQHSISVCNVTKSRCVVLQKLPAEAEVTAFTVDPANKRLFYCISQDFESVVWSSWLSGQNAKDLATVHNCTGLAVDSFKQKLYVAENNPPKVITMDFEGNYRHTLIANDKFLESPHRMTIFEDQLYFMVANSFKLSKCNLFGHIECEPYIYKAFDSSAFVIDHESIQRDDVSNYCRSFDCANLCVLGRIDPLCVCDDGRVLRSESCELPKDSKLPITNDPKVNAAQNSSTGTAIVVVLVVFTFIFFGFVYYRYCRCARTVRGGLPVRFDNTLSPTTEDGPANFETAALDMPVEGSRRNEFTNPLDSIRNFWRRSFARNRPIGTASLSIDIPTQGDSSDTESDLGTRLVK